jgi:hypothetical protein
MLPNRIFFTGVPGSRWSGVAQTLETIPGFNTSDRTPARTYSHHAYSGHQGAYFGYEMEFEPHVLWTGPEYIDQAWLEPGGTRLVKSHNWTDRFDDIEKRSQMIGSCWFIVQTWLAMLGGTKQVDFKYSIPTTVGTKTVQKCCVRSQNKTNAYWSMLAKTTPPGVILPLSGLSENLDTV